MGQCNDEYRNDRLENGVPNLDYAVLQRLLLGNASSSGRSSSPTLSYAAR
jgi:hypothetical protein